MTARKQLIENCATELTRTGKIPSTYKDWMTFIEKIADWQPVTYKYYGKLGAHGLKRLIDTIETQARENQSLKGYQVRKVLCWTCGAELGDYVQATAQGEVHAYNIGFRDDKHFCSDACGAKYHRDNGSPHIHVDLPKQQPRNCEVCGAGFYTNDYADREGQREPLYCSGACRQKAYRLRKKLKKD